MHPEENTQQTGAPPPAHRPAHHPAPPAHPAPSARAARKRRWPRRLGAGAVVLVVFGLGYGVGAGIISWKQHNPVSGNLPNKLDYSSVNQVYQSIKDNYDGKLTEAQLEDGLKHGLAASTNDPYTVYFTPKEAKEFNQQLNNSFSGIGAQLGQDKDKNVQVIAPIEGLPADKAGLKAGDLIVRINGTSTSGMSLDDAVSRIRGPKGTKVALQVVRDKSQTLTLTITRDNITLPSVKTRILDGNVGYLQLTDFANDTAGLTQQAANEFRGKNVSGIILDMRNNGGGYLDAAEKISSLWLKPGQKILDEKHGTEVIDTMTATGDNPLNGIPTVILVNGGTASAAEITAGALHDNGAAYIIGEKTYGKGVVQQLINFRDDSQLKVTIASWYRPNGQNINKKGITPDKILKLTQKDADAGQDPQLQAAQEYLKIKR
jgi:carboxyl-terminal processing protease